MQLKQKDRNHRKLKYLVPTFVRQTSNTQDIENSNNEQPTNKLTLIKDILCIHINDLSEKN